MNGNAEYSLISTALNFEFPCVKMCDSGSDRRRELKQLHGSSMHDALPSYTTLGEAPASMCVGSCGGSSRTDVSTVDATHCIMMKLGDTLTMTKSSARKNLGHPEKTAPVFDFVAESQLILNCPFNFSSRASQWCTLNHQHNV